MGIELVSRPAMRLKGAIGKKNVIAGMVAALATGAISVPSTAAGIELGEGLSVSGFADMSFFSSNPDGAPTTSQFGIDQFEMDFMYEGSGGVSAQVDIEYGESSSGASASLVDEDLDGVPDAIAGDSDSTFVEQAFITKKFNDQFSMKVGRFLSYSGWEAEEPTGLYQYSGVGYAPFFYGYYQQGVSAYYDGGMVDFMASVVNSAFNPLDRNTKELGYEVGVAVQPVEGLTAKLFFISNKDDAAGDSDEIINAWVSYGVGKLLFAGEYNTADYATGGEGDGYLAMANYTSGKWGFTARYGAYEIENAAGVTTVDNTSITLSPSYKVGDNLLLVAEYRMDDYEGGGDVNTFALEALFTF
jgi:hypothetical protein